MFGQGYSESMAREVMDLLKCPSWSQPWIDKAIAERHKRLVGWHRRGLTVKKGWRIR